MNTSSFIKLFIYGFRYSGGLDLTILLLVFIFGCIISAIQLFLLKKSNLIPIIFASIIMTITLGLFCTLKSLLKAAFEVEMAAQIHGCCPNESLLAFLSSVSISLLPLYFASIFTIIQIFFGAIASMLYINNRKKSN